ncbi:sugar ABC transporter ATP-binding protein [Pseudopelagicola sp. nBUS_20]|uniref:sugar ABC transporter ATP-binding protein n=1 Tax=Pseudopelagicola sp. nBUS_20 TaxID=3395317 RepID=UPI003EBF5CC7
MPAASAKISGLTKSFGSNRVLRGIDIELVKGEVAVLMGANGAGKSTLVKVICGVYQADSGTISLNGQPFKAQTPYEAIHAGVVTVHQSINDGVIPDLDVASNLLLDKLAEPGSGFFLKKRQIRAQAREIAASMGLNVDVTRLVRELDLADRQLVAIARAMTHEPELLILDEPTSSLSATEADRLFGLLNRLRDAGVAILYISHRTSDIQRMADRIYAMRDGEITGHFEQKPLDYEAAVNAMLGHGMSDVDLDIRSAGAEVLNLSRLKISAMADPIDLTIHEDEVVAITGLVGAGKTALSSILFGQRKSFSGTIELNGAPFSPRSAREAIDAGVFLCPKDRGTTGVLSDHSLAKNITAPFLTKYSNLSFIRRRKEGSAARETIQQLNIVCQSEHDDIGTLSGGNQQKVMVGRWLSQPSKLLILDEPFQGVDIKARRDIAAKIRETAKGRATIVMASEMDEVLEIADRIIVLTEHSVAGEHRNQDLDLKTVLAQVAGHRKTDNYAGQTESDTGMSAG